MSVTTPVIHRYDDKSPGAWNAFIAAMRSGEQFECDEEMYMYWLEALPPAFMGRTVTFPDGKVQKCHFGFAEGADLIVAYWHEGKLGLQERSEGGVVCSLHLTGTPETRYFGRLTNIRHRG